MGPFLSFFLRRKLNSEIVLAIYRKAYQYTNFYKLVACSCNINNAQPLTRDYNCQYFEAITQ